MPPLAVRIPTAACMPPTSSGLVSVLTYIFAKKKKLRMQKMKQCNTELSYAVQKRLSGK